MHWPAVEPDCDDQCCAVINEGNERDWTADGAVINTFIIGDGDV